VIGNVMFVTTDFDTIALDASTCAQVAHHLDL